MRAMSPQAVVVFLFAVAFFGCAVAQLARFAIKQRLNKIDPDKWSWIFHPATPPTKIRWFESRFLSFVFAPEADDATLAKLKIVYRFGAAVWWIPLVILFLWALIPLVAR